MTDERKKVENPKIFLKNPKISKNPHKKDVNEQIKKEKGLQNSVISIKMNF